MSAITTFTGAEFDPINPNVDSLNILDIAHSLSMICRCNGHTRCFYSVAQHSLACAKEAEIRGLSKEVIIGCLLHDASEAYLSDVTRPIKKELSYYLSVEEKLQELIWNKFIGRNLTKEEKELIFEIDDQMLSLEFKELMPTLINDEYKKLMANLNFVFEDMEKVKKEFISMYYKYFD